MINSNSPFARLSNFDALNLYRYVKLEIENLDWLTNLFKYVDTEHYPGDTFKLDKLKTSSTSYRTTYVLSNDDKEIHTMVHLQSETRKVCGQDLLVYLNIPLINIKNKVKRSAVSLFDLNVVTNYFKELEEIGLTRANYADLTTKYNNLYPEREPDYNSHIWNFGLHEEQYYSFKNYKQLILPINDSDETLFYGSSHTLFYSCFLNHDYVSTLITVPKKDGKFKTKFYKCIPKEVFNNERFFLYYIDLEEEKVYEKEYPVELYKEYRQNIDYLDTKVDLNQFKLIIQ